MASVQKMGARHVLNHQEPTVKYTLTEDVKQNSHASVTPRGERLSGDGNRS